MKAYLHVSAAIVAILTAGNSYAEEPDSCWRFRDAVAEAPTVTRLSRLLEAPVAQRCTETRQFGQWRMRGFSIRTGTPEEVEYGRALRAGTRNAYETFLQRYPDSEYAEVIENLLPQPLAPPPPPPGPPPPSPPPPPPPQGLTEEQWQAQIQHNLVVEARAQRLRAANAAQSGDTTVHRRFRDCTDCPEMVAIPAGTIQMAISSGGAADRTSVALATFAVSRFEITRAEFYAFAPGQVVEGLDCAAPSVTGAWETEEYYSHYQREPAYSGMRHFPSACVSWNDAQAFINRLNARVPGAPYRLLSEAEWEYAARGGTTSRFWWGENEAEMCRYANGADASAVELTEIASCDDGEPEVAAVGQFAENLFGLHDMAGNVWEWTQDCYSTNYRATPTNGQPNITGNCRERVLRGGSWTSPIGFLSSSARHHSPIDSRFRHVGFRVARRLDER